MVGKGNLLLFQEISSTFLWRDNVNEDARIVTGKKERGNKSFLGRNETLLSR